VYVAGDQETASGIGAVLCGSAVTVAAFGGTRIVDAETLLAYVRHRVWAYVYSNTRSAAQATRAVQAIRIIVFLDPSIGGGLWVDVDPLSQLPAASLLIEMDLLDGLPGRFRVFTPGGFTYPPD